MELIESDLNRPWVPSNMPTFRVGDRVRVRLSGECPGFCADVGEDGDIIGQNEGHPVEANGRIGRVTTMPPSLARVRVADNSHPIYVALDEHPYVKNRGFLHGLCVAPFELELLEANDA